MNTLLNLINHQPKIREIFLYAKGPYELKYRYVIKTCKGFGLRLFLKNQTFPLNTQMI